MRYTNRGTGTMRSSVWAVAMVVTLGAAGDARAQENDDWMQPVALASLEYGLDLREALEELSALETLSVIGQDPTVLYRQARRELNDENYREAARLFRRLRAEYRDSEYTGDSYYYEAFALYRTGSARDLERAMELLDEQRREYPDAATRGDAPALRVQIESGLARRGDERSRRDIIERARSSEENRSSDPCDTADQELRAMALNALLNMDSDRAVPILREVLESRDDCSVELRRQAVFLVSQKMDDEAIDILLDLAHRNPDPDQEVREQAVFWLSQVGGDEAAAALIDILRSSDDRNVQESAIFALSQHGGEDAWEVLREYAERSDAPVELRENAIFWLGQARGGGGYLRGLYDRLDEPSLKENVIFGISQSGTDEDAEWLLERALDEREDMDVRKNALFWAGQLGMEVDQLADLYESVEDREMKEAVIFALSQSDDKTEAVTQMMRIAEGEEDSDLKQDAIFWLGQMDDERVADFLLRILRSGGGTIR